MNKAAQKLGRMARSIPKRFSPEQREARRQLMIQINNRKKLQKESMQLVK
jgi:hypothetical protein